MRENLLSASAEVTLDGKVYVLRYRAYAFIVYAEQCGGDLLFDLRDVAAKLTAMQAAVADGGAMGIGPIMAHLRDLLWAGLADVQPELKRDQVSRLFGFADLNKLTPVIIAALNLALPQATPAENGRPIGPALILSDSESSDGAGSGQSSATGAASAQ